MRIIALAIHILETNGKTVDFLQLQASKQDGELPPHPYYAQKFDMRVIPGLSDCQTPFGLEAGSEEGCRVMTRLLKILQKGREPNWKQIQSVIAVGSTSFKRTTIETGVQQYIELWKRFQKNPSQSRGKLNLFPALNMR